MTRARTVITALAAALALTTATACGDSEEDKAKSAVEDYLAAVQDGNGNEACDLVTDASRKRIETAAKRSCADTISSLKQGRGAALLNALEGAEVEQVKVDGDRGTADIKPKNLPAQKTNLRKEGGDWKLEAPGIGA